MIHLGTQYYRAPFPEERFWDDDMRRMKDSGLNTVQLWVLWAWVEARPGQFDFGDYDRLVATADKHGLQVVLSTIAEIQPYWIHREVPGSEMVNNLGHKVVSSNRNECHFGLTPGGCTDNPGVWERLRAYLEAVAKQYVNASNLAGWDSWNELRWNVHCDGLVCRCEHTLQAFYNWLDEMHGGLDGLNRTWKRRYDRWEDLLPGKNPGQPFTEMMAWEHFLTWKACEHGKARYDVIKAIDPNRPVTLHGGQPSTGYCGNPGNMTTLDRGNDWFFADHLDGVGCSSFPKWFGIDDADFGLRIETVRSAARGKHIWLSELQGGRSAQGLSIHQPVDAKSQQRWIWNGYACGADTILFWCWRDEVFCREAGGYGLIGLDGLAEERLAAMRVTGDVLSRYNDVLEQYKPCAAEVGVLFSPQSYYYYYAVEGNARLPQKGLSGYGRGLVRSSIPFSIVEEEHLEELDRMQVLFVPRATALAAAVQEKLLAFVEQGGTLVAESECGAFDPAGLYSYPDERFLAKAAGIVEVGRRQLAAAAFTIDLDGEKTDVAAAQWLTPVAAPDDAAVHAANDDGALLLTVPCGKGRIIYVGSYFGDAYRDNNNLGFEKFLRWCVDSAGRQPGVDVVEPTPTADSFLYIKHGIIGDRKMVYVFFQEQHEQAAIRFAGDFFQSRRVTDLISGSTHDVSERDGKLLLELNRPEWGFAVLLEEEI